MRFAMIDTGNLVRNTVEFADADTAAAFPLPQGWTLRAAPTAGIGDTWDGAAFAAPPLPPPTAEASNAALEAQILAIESGLHRAVRELLLAQAGGDTAAGATAVQHLRDGDAKITALRAARR